MNKCIAVLLLASSGSAFAGPYVDGSKPFMEITDANRQGEAWAMCSASYDFMAELFESKPAISQRMKEWANGAQLATGMALIMRADITDMTTDKFYATWAYSKVAMEEWPKSARTTILFDAEILGAEGQEEWVDNLTSTSKICIDNLESQQVYIDTFREFMKSGLFELPEN